MGKINLKSFLRMKDIYQMSECPVCLQHIEPEAWVQCRNGHHGCRSCFSKLSKCPLCRVSIQNMIKTMSNDYLKTILKELRHAENVAVEQSSLLKIFICDICDFPPNVKPIFQCEEGHLICKQCFEKFRHCWSCAVVSKVRPSSEIRGLVIEKLLQGIPKPCRFSGFGCCETISGLDHHELNCDYMLVDCAVHSCYTRHPLRKLLEHVLQNQHYDLQLPTDMNNVPNALKVKLTIPVNLHREPDYYDSRDFFWNRVFFLQLSKKNNFFLSCLASNIFREINFVVLYVGTLRDSEKFYFKLRFYTENTGKEMTVIKNVVPASVGKTAAFVNPHSFKLPYDDIQAFWKSDEIKVRFQISVYERHDENNNV